MTHNKSTSIAVTSDDAIASQITGLLSKHSCEKTSMLITTGALWRESTVSPTESKYCGKCFHVMALLCYMIYVFKPVTRKMFPFDDVIMWYRPRFTIYPTICFWSALFRCRFIHDMYFPIFFRTASPAPGKPYNHPSVSEITLRDMGKIDLYQSLIKDDKAWTEYIFPEMYCSINIQPQFIHLPSSVLPFHIFQASVSILHMTYYQIIANSSTVSTMRDWMSKKCLYRFEIWHATRQQCCRGACQISAQLRNSNHRSRSFETLRDFPTRRLMPYWNGTQETCL